MTTKTMIRIITLSMGLLSAVPVASFAQTQEAPAPTRSALPAGFDARWTPYLGCWRLHQESARAFSVAVSDVMMVCVAPASTGGGVSMTTYAAGRAILTQTIVADGQSHPVNEADCQGSQTNEWSHDGERLFTRVEVSCNGRPKRDVSGVTVMTKGPMWVDVQATVVDADSQVRIRRYQRTTERPAGVAELPASLSQRAADDSVAVSVATMSLEDVMEASKKISSPALEAAIDETGARFTLNSRTLKQLAAAGVSPNVIDLMIAQSFPEKFQIDRASLGAPPVPSSISAGGTSIIYGGGMPASMGYPYYDPYYSYYSYYSPFAYPYWGSNYYYSNYYYRGYPNTYIVPGGGGTVIGPAIPIVQPAENGGRIVNGRGYTRVTPGSSNGSTGSDDPAISQHTVGAPRTVRPTGGDASGGGSVSTSGYSSGSSSSGGGSSSGSSSTGSSAPASSGSSGDSGGGRTAQPR